MTRQPDAVHHRIFRLLVPSSPQHGGDIAAIEVCGRRWTLTEATRFPRPGEAPSYECISYAWGLGRAANPLGGDTPISDRTMAVLHAAIGTQNPQAVWIDALCVPFEDPARSACLSSMGAIYARASRVIVVLSEPCRAMLEELGRSDPPAIESLLAFERDDWVERVWTYQELVNNGNVRFITEGGGDAWADALDVLNKVGHALQRERDSQPGIDLDTRSRYPRLDALEDLIADWMVSGPLDRTAYQVISNMHMRSFAALEHLYHAMIGAIVDLPPDDALLFHLDATERFFRICETKGDHSFIYTTSPRESIVGRRWRPRPTGRLEAVLPWHSWGGGQSGHLHPDYLELDRVGLEQPGSISPSAVGAISQRVEEWGRTLEDAPRRILQQLRFAGFSGSGDLLETSGGYMFMQSPLPNEPELFVAVATGIRTTYGSPALLLKRDKSGVHEYRDVGVFVGPPPLATLSIRVK